MRMGLIHSRIRTDEKRLMEAARSRSVEVVPIDNTTLVFQLEERHLDVDVVLERCIDHHRAEYALTVLNSWGIPTVNREQVVETYGNRLLMSQALLQHGVKTPAVRVAFTPESALEAMLELGYPVVMKPVEGPKEQLISRIQDKYTAETVLEHKRILGTYHHSIFYLQKYIDAPGHDIRAFVVGTETVAALSVQTSHWIRPIEEGWLVEPYPVTPELNAVAVRAAEAMGGGIVAVDLIRTKDEWYVVDVGTAIGLAEASRLTGADIPDRIVRYAIETLNTGSVHP